MNTTVSQSTDIVKILFFGSSGILSLIPLKHLLKSEHFISAIVIRSQQTSITRDSRFPILIENPTSLEFLAQQHKIPVIKLTADTAQYIEEIKGCRPDLILVSCFSVKLPEEILSIPPLGSYNLHPSLLPSFRGPTPLFWQFRQGVRKFGISLHKMTNMWDAGDIIVQRETKMPDGISIKQAERVLAVLSVQLIQDALTNLSQNNVTCISNQLESSYQSFPETKDYELSAQWSAKRMFNFICATKFHGVIYNCQVNNKTYQLLEADSYSRQTLTHLTIEKQIIKIPCLSGFLTARLAKDIAP